MLLDIGFSVQYFVDLLLYVFFFLTIVYCLITPSVS